ncbi:spindle assembly abnormal protein 6 homolog isoform X4 [Anarrhichthys ocellatus]|uniref:spindle assembly abnormal protein 6 homolog isoform X4 n=1 Tax=Anarrhichthys ocellatus TaxID=433405 RepID=UPI0012EE5FD3|nr:spindle assembly abnormal protein 6 homolog isoform X4 [Anarrhichthys ocellatus]
MAATKGKCPVITSPLRCWPPLDLHPPWLLLHPPYPGQLCLQSPRPLAPPLMGEQTHPHHPHTRPLGHPLTIAPPSLESPLETQVDSTKPRKANIRVTIELQLTNSPGHKRDLLVRLTDDTDPYFLFNLSISEEDFQSLKVQQGLLIDFASFPQKFIDLLNLCYSEQESDNPRFLLHLSSQSPVLEGPANFSVVETNAFKHLNHLSLRLFHGSDKEIKDYLAVCLSSLKAEKQALEMKLQKTNEDLSRQLSYAQQTLSEKTKELDKLRSEWTSQTSSLSSRHCKELQSEREKALELQSRLQQQTELLRQELENSHKKSSQQLHSRLTELEASCRELTERKYKNESVIRDLKIKLVGVEEECQRSKQQILSLRRENSSLDTELHDKERLGSQLQMRVAVLEQEIKDKDQLMHRSKEVLEAIQQQKESMEENAESKELQITKLEATVKSLSEELIKANGIIKKLQGEVRGLVGKIKVKNTVTVSQEKLLQDTSGKLENVEKDLQSTQQQLVTRDEQVSKLKEQLETTVQKLNESREVLKTNENVINWLNKQLNEKQLSRKSQSAEPLDRLSLLSTATGLKGKVHRLLLISDQCSKPSDTLETLQVWILSTLRGEMIASQSMVCHLMCFTKSSLGKQSPP